MCGEETERVAGSNIRRHGYRCAGGAAGTEDRGEGGGCVDCEVGVEVGRDAVIGASGRGDGASDGDALGMAR